MTYRLLVALHRKLLIGRVLWRAARDEASAKLTDEDAEAKRRLETDSFASEASREIDEMTK